MNNNPTHNHRSSKYSIELAEAREAVTLLRDKLMSTFRTTLKMGADRAIDALESRNRELLTCLGYMDHVRESAEYLQEICRPMDNEPTQAEIMRKSSDTWDMAKTVTTNVQASLISLNKAVDEFVRIYGQIAADVGQDACWRMFQDLNAANLAREPVYKGLWVEFLGWTTSKGIKSPLNQNYNGSSLAMVGLSMADEELAKLARDFTKTCSKPPKT